MISEYKIASETLKKEGITLAKVDASKEAELAKEHMVQGFPTLTVFKKGVKFEDYTGERNADAIMAYMRKLNDPNWAPPPSAVIPLTADNFTKFVKNEKLSLAMWYAPWCKHCKQVMPGKNNLPNKTVYVTFAHKFLYYKHFVSVSMGPIVPLFFDE